MNAENFTLCEKLIPSTYVQQGVQSKKILENAFRELLEKRKWPEDGWDDARYFLLDIKVSHYSVLLEVILLARKYKLNSSQNENTFI